jgi:peptide/nickel transport system substrate-binding protein
MCTTRPSGGRLRLVALLTVLLTLAAACAGDDDGATDDGPSTSEGSDTPDTTDAREPEDGGTLVFAVEADSDGYHPIDNRWAISGNFVGSTIYEPLLAENGDGTLEPWLAESVTPNDDLTEWTIVTKEGITFHDGTPFDAEAVKMNIDARLASALTATANEPIESVAVTADNTAVVTMKRPWSAYDHALAAVGGYMAAPAMLGEDGDPSLVIGTGPFTFDEWIPEDHLTVSRNDDYWREPAHLDAIDFRFLPDSDTRAATLEAGDIDAIITADPGATADFREMDGIDSYEHSSEPFHVMLNSAVPPFDDLDARRVLAYGTDRASMITTLGGDEVLEEADTAFVPANPWHLDDAGYPDYDPEQAAELAEQYEADNGEPISVVIKGSTGQQEDMANALIEQWSAIGVDATFEPVDQATLISQIVFGDYEAVLWRSHNWVDPDFNYIFWHSSLTAPVGELSVNFTHLQNDEIDAALDAGRSTLDPDERRAAYDDVQRLLNEELTHLWLFGQVWALATQDDVHGWDDIVDRGLSRLEPKVVWADVWMEQ